MRRATMTAAVVVAAMLVPAAGAAGKTNTKVTMDAAFYASGQTHWAGDIFSPKKKCKNERRVLIFRVRPGADQKMGSTKSFKGISQPGYFWTFFIEGAAPTGNYYAKVRPTTACKGDRSENLKLQ